MNAQTTTRERTQAAQPVPAPQLPAQRPAPSTVPAQGPAPMAYPRALAAALMAIRREVDPVAKAGENKFHGYKYPKAEDVVDEVVPLLLKHGVMIIQSEISRSMLNGEAILAINYEYVIVNQDGDVWPDRPQRTGLAQARDQKGVCDDKAASKCSTQSEKYFLIKFFGIRTSDAANNDNDAGPDKPTLPSAPTRPTTDAPVREERPIDEEPPEPPAEEPPEPPAAAAADGLDIPEFLRRTDDEAQPTDFDEEQWLRDLAGACSGAEDADQLQHVQAKVQLPARDLVSPAAWERGKDIVMARAADLLPDEEEPPDQ